MKLLVIIGAVHFDEKIKKILEEAGVPTFSRSDISGHNNKPAGDLSQNWFAVSNNYQKSVMFFAFTEKETAKKAISLVEEFNDTININSKVNSFLLAVESHN